MPGHQAGDKPYPNNLKYLIKLYGYKLVEVANELQIPRSTLYDYISGNRPAPREYLRQIASFRGCEFSEIHYRRVADPFNRLPDEGTSQAVIEQQVLDGAGGESTRAEELVLPPGASWGSTENTACPLSLTGVDLELPPSDYAAWFGMKLAHLFTVITHGEARARGCGELQAILNKEILMFDAIKPPASGEEYSISRRQAILAIAGLPLALLAAVQRGHWSTLVKEEFLSRCAASVTACWHLMAGREFSEVERALASYLPLLITWAKQPSSQQQVSADLAAQGTMLMGLVALHTFPSSKNLHSWFAHCKQAVEYAKVSENRMLHVTALAHLGAATGEIGQPAEMLQKYLEAAQYLNEVPPLLQSRLYIELADAYASNGYVQEALRCIGEARATLPGENTFVPIFLSDGSGLFHQILKEGKASLALGTHQPDSDHYEHAQITLAQVETLPPTTILPERIRVEIVNLQALAAAKAGNLEQFCDYLEKGIHGAKALGSEKRRREAIDIYWEARKIWPHEARVKDLSDLFISMN